VEGRKADRVIIIRVFRRRLGGVGQKEKQQKTVELKGRKGREAKKDYLEGGGRKEAL
jgi:hypothetical protein